MTEGSCLLKKKFTRVLYPFSALRFSTHGNFKQRKCYVATTYFQDARPLTKDYLNSIQMKIRAMRQAENALTKKGELFDQYPLPGGDNQNDLRFHPYRVSQRSTLYILHLSHTHFWGYGKKFLFFNFKPLRNSWTMSCFVTWIWKNDISNDFLSLKVKIWPPCGCVMSVNGKW